MHKIVTNNNKRLYYRCCPACNYKKFKPYIDISPENFYRHLFEKSFKANIVKCINCAMIYTNPILIDVLLLDSYLKGYQSQPLPKVKNPFDLLSEYHFITASKMLKLAKGKKSVLDIGCNFGEFVYFLQQLGFEAYGIDIMMKRIEYGKRYFKISNISSETIQEVNISSFDIVNLSQVLEHIPNPYQFLNQICSRMKKGAFIFVSVPNFGALLHLHHRKNVIISGGPYHHINNFTYKHLLLLLKKCGINEVNQPNIFNAKNLNFITKLKETINISFLKLFNTLPFNLMIIGKNT